jgi:predicted ATPase
MFFYIDLSKTKPFIIIDEPEISVSVNNQERILGHIMLSAQGMIVATHSPIIVYRSEYENYMRDLDKDFKLDK